MLLPKPFLHVHMQIRDAMSFQDSNGSKGLNSWIELPLIGGGTMLENNPTKVSIRIVWL